jgi:prepilin-type N-terminal cleavage/methylation domain-containing protein
VKRPGRGFTLIELLVVIGIIGLLMALLFPGLRAAFDAAAEAACQNNIGQLAKAVASYCTQYGGSFPLGVVGSLGGSNNYSASNWLYCFNGGKRDFDQGLLARLNYIGKTDIFYCPEDVDTGYKRPGTALLLPSGTAPTSYAINASITYGDVPYQIGPGFPAVVRSRRFDVFDARDFMFIEESDAGNNEARPSDFDCGHMTPVGNYHLTSRHRGGGYLSCMDGHVEWYNADDFETGMNRLSGADWYKQTFPRPTGAPAGKESPEEVASHWNPG